MKYTKIITVVLCAFSFSVLAQNQAPAPAPTDPQIAHIVVTADKTEINAGMLAKSKSKNKEVKKFAQVMVTDHTSINNKAMALAKKLHLTPEDNDTSKTIMKGADENMAKLKDLKGQAFDKAYIDDEVASHQAVLEAIDKVLIPNAKNTELKSLLEKTRPVISEHLEHAQKVQADLAK